MRQVLIFLLLAVVARSSAAAEKSNHFPCRLQGTVGFSASLFAKKSEAGETHLHPLFDGDVGVELECHLSTSWTLVVEVALGMNTSPAMQMPVTAGILHALNKRVALGLGATGVFHPYGANLPFGGGLGGLMIQLAISEKVEAVLLVGPAFELEAHEGHAPSATPGASSFLSLAFR